jgi:hypothetical protein
MSKRDLAAWAALLTGVLALSACKPPKYSLYTSVQRDFQVDVPWAWEVLVENEGADFSNASFIGPFEPDFYLGAPSFSIRWHKSYYPHRLPKGLLEMYVDADDYISQTLQKVYGPRYTLLWRDKQGVFHPCLEDAPCITSVEVSGRQGKHFIVKSAAPAQPGARWGTALDGQGRDINPRQHAYVVVPMSRGFYVLIYPATREGYPKYEKRFNRLVNSFLPLKDGPGGAPLGRAASLPLKE